MPQRIVPKTLFLSLTFFVCVVTSGQNQPSLGDVARQAKAAKSAQSKKAPKVITNDDMCEQTADTKIGAGTEDPEIAAFLARIAGRWDLSYFRKGNTLWYPDHGMSAPKNKTVYDFGPKELVIRFMPEFGLSSVTDRFVYGSVRQVSSELFDVELQKSCDPAGTQVKRFKLSSDGKTLELAADADTNPNPTVEVLVRQDTN